MTRQRGDGHSVSVSVHVDASTGGASPVSYVVSMNSSGKRMTLDELIRFVEECRTWDVPGATIVEMRTAGLSPLALSRISTTGRR